MTAEWLGNTALSFGWENASTNGRLYNNGTYSSTSTFTSGVVMIAYDQGAGKIWFGLNGTWLGSGDPATGANPSYTGIGAGRRYFCMNAASGSGSSYAKLRIPSEFSYSVPSGFSTM